MLIKVLLFESMVLLQVANLIFYLKNDFEKKGVKKVSAAIQIAQLLNSTCGIIWLWQQHEYLILAGYALAGVCSVMILLRLVLGWQKNA